MIDYKHATRVKSLKEVLEIIGGSICVCSLLVLLYVMLVLISEGVI